MEQENIHYKIARIVIFFWLLGWYCKILFYGPYLLENIYLYPVTNEFFPKLFLNPHLSVGAYFLPLTALSVFFSNHKKTFQCASFMLVVCAAVMGVHINSYNDATFVTSFWVAVWLLWFSFKLDDEHQHVFLHARFLAQCLLGMIFLGGVVGKLTPEYFRGEIVYQIFIEQTDKSPLSWICAPLSVEAKRMMASVISKIVIMSEGVLALSPFLSFSLVCVLAFCLIPLLMLFSTWRILSVISCLLGLLFACLVWTKSK